MTNQAKYFSQGLWGLIVSALGTIPFGVVNVTSMQIAIGSGMAIAWSFAIGAALVEVAYARIMLVGLQKIMQYKRLLIIMDWLAVAIVAGLAFGAMYAAMHPAEQTLLSYTNLHPMAAFLLGLSLSATNPMQFPFWFGWSAVLINSGKLQTGFANFNIYTIGIGLGTLTGLCLFIFGGLWLNQRLGNSQQVIQWSIGIILAITAVVLLYKILSGKGSKAMLEKKINEDELPAEN